MQLPAGALWHYNQELKMKMFKDLNEEEEKEFRQWARKNYKPLSIIKGVWHPVVQDECVKINKEFEKKLNVS